MGRIILEKDWTGNPVGPILNWPQSLKTSLSIILRSKFPMVILWGDEYTFFYNDAYRPSLGSDGKHPAVLGISASEVFKEGWDYVKDLVASVYHEGKSVMLEDLLIPIIRDGREENVYWTFSYSPITDETDKIKGIFITTLETTDRVLGRKSFEENTRALDLAMEIAELGVFKVDIINDSCVYSQKIMDNLNLERQNMCLSEIFTHIYPDDQQMVANEISKTLQGENGGKHDLIYRVFHKPTQQIKYLRSIGKVNFIGDTAESISGVIQDVTKQILARNALVEREEELRIAIEGGELGTYNYYPQTGEAKWSAKTKEFFGLSPESEINYESYVNAIHPDDRSIALNAFQKAMSSSGNGKYESEYRVIGINDRKLRWIRPRGKVFFDANGTPIRVSGIIQDITERKIFEQALEDSKDRFQAAVQAIEGYLWTNNAKGEMEGKQPGWEEITGQTYEEYQGYGWAKALHPDDVEPTIAAWQEAVKDRTTFVFEHRVKLKNGDWGYFSVRAIPLLNTDGTIREWVGVHTNITEQRRALEQLELNNNQLKKINNDLDNFIYTASHDLKAPMSNIEGLLEALRGSLEDEGKVQNEDTAIFLNMMQQSVNRFKSTIIDLTDISRVQREINEDLDDVNLEGLVEDIEFNIQDKIKESSAIMKKDFSECNRIKFSKKNLNSIIYNLISNAIKYRHPERKPEVIIKTNKLNGFVVLTVKDNGLGIPANNVNKIFTMFKRFHDHVEGTGIGLYIVKRIVDNAGGKIEVESEEGKGTVFRVYFPRHLK